MKATRFYCKNYESCGSKIDVCETEEEAKPFPLKSKVYPGEIYITGICPVDKRTYGIREAALLDGN